MSLPENQRKLEAADALARLADEAGVSLVELAVAFVINHPAVTSAIIGPRTTEQLETQLGAADLVLTDWVQDRIDAIVLCAARNARPASASPPEFTETFGACYGHHADA
jgi:aryl-alcohol dehydrogenase-like predicted oxidoreductase